MPKPIEAYREGYEKGRSDSAGGRLAEMTMGTLRDDPGGHFQKGYSDGAAGRPFDAPSIPQKSLAKGLIPKFSDNPLGWFLGVCIVVECWVLWQLIKAPFQLVGSLMRGEKPSPSVIVRNSILAGLAIALVWWAPHIGTSAGTEGPPSIASGAPVQQSEYAKAILGRWYPETTFCSHAGDRAYEFFRGGRLRAVAYADVGNGCTLIRFDRDGAWEIRGNVLLWNENGTDLTGPLHEDRFNPRIIFLSRDMLRIESQGWQGTYRRQPAGPYPAF